MNNIHQIFYHINIEVAWFPILSSKPIIFILSMISSNFPGIPDIIILAFNFAP